MTERVMQPSWNFDYKLPPRRNRNRKPMPAGYAAIMFAFCAVAGGYFWDIFNDEGMDVLRAINSYGELDLRSIMAALLASVPCIAGTGYAALAIAYFTKLIDGPRGR